jgi:hypothetical protein
MARDESAAAGAGRAAAGRRAGLQRLPALGEPARPALSDARGAGRGPAPAGAADAAPADLQRRRVPRIAGAGAAVRPAPEPGRLARPPAGQQRARNRGGGAGGTRTWQRRTRDRRQRNPAARQAGAGRASCLPRPAARRAGGTGIHRRTLAHLAAPAGTGRARRFHHRAPAAVLGGRAGRSRGGRDPAPLRPGAGALSRQAHRDRRNRLAQRRRGGRRGAADAGGAGPVRAFLPGARAGVRPRLLPDGGRRPALETRHRRGRRRTLGHAGCGAAAEVRARRPALRRPLLANQSRHRLGRRAGGHAAFPAGLRRHAAVGARGLRDHRPGRGFVRRAAGHAAAGQLPAPAGSRRAGGAGAGAGLHGGDPADADLRVRRAVLGRQPAPARGAATAARRQRAAFRQHPRALLQRAAGDGERHHRQPAGAGLARA